MESVEGEDASSEGATRRQAGVASLFAVAVAGFSCLIGWELSAVFSPSLPLLSFLRYSDGNFYTMHFCVDACFRLWLLCGES